MRLRSPAPLRYPGTSLCSSSDTGGEGELAVPEEVHGQREDVQVACRA